MLVAALLTIVTLNMVHLYDRLLIKRGTGEN